MVSTKGGKIREGSLEEGSPLSSEPGMSEKFIQCTAVQFTLPLYSLRADVNHLFVPDKQIHPLNPPLKTLCGYWCDVGRSLVDVMV